MAEFREDIEQFRCWILESELLALRRHDEYLRGELGLVLLKQASHEAIRQAMPALVVDVGLYLRNELERLGYTSAVRYVNGEKPTNVHRHQSPVNLSLKASATRVSGIVVSAMQDEARLTVALEAGGGDRSAFPDKVWNRLWFRRHILGVSKRCVYSERMCHIRGLSVGEGAVGDVLPHPLSRKTI